MGLLKIDSWVGMETALFDRHNHKFAKQALQCFRTITRMLSAETDIQIWETVTDGNLCDQMAEKRAGFHSASAFLSFCFRVRSCLSLLVEDPATHWPRFWSRKGDDKEDGLYATLPIEIKKMQRDSALRGFFKRLHLDLQTHTHMVSNDSMRMALSFLYGFLFATDRSLIAGAHRMDGAELTRALMGQTTQSLIEAYKSYHEQGRVRVATSLSTFTRHLFLINVIFVDVLKVSGRPLKTDDFGILRRMADDTKRTQKKIMDQPSTHRWITDPKETEAIHVFNAKEVRALYLACDTLFEKIMFGVLFGTGMRMAGFCRITNPSVQHQLAVSNAPSLSFAITEKGSKSVRYKCPPFLVELVQRWVTAGSHNQKYLFPARTGVGHLGTRDAHLSFMAVAARAGLNGSYVHPHTTRHTVIWTLWALAHGPVAQHETGMDRYIRPTDEDVAADIDPPCDTPSVTKSNLELGRELSLALASPFLSTDGRTFPVTLVSALDTQSGHRATKRREKAGGTKRRAAEMDE